MMFGVSLPFRLMICSGSLTIRAISEIFSVCIKYKMDDDINHLIDHHHLSVKKPILHPSFASLVSYIASGTRGYLFATRKVSSAAFNIFQYSTWVSIDFTRRLFVNGISAVMTARIKAQTPQDGQHLDHLNYWTICSVGFLQSTFSLTELITMTSFNVASETVKFSLESAESMVNLFDGLFGDTETSKCIAAFISLWCDLLKSRLVDMGYGNTTFGQMMMMGHMAKSIMVKIILNFDD